MEKNNSNTELLDQFKRFKDVVHITKNIDFENRISKLNANISKLSSASSRNIFQDLIKSVYTSNTGSEDKMNIPELLKDFGVSGATISTNRRVRYSDYEDIVEKISYAKRALKVMTNSIISPDDYTFDTFKYQAANMEDVDILEIIKVFKHIAKELNIENNIDEIIETTLWYGDYFAEIVVAEDQLKTFGLIENISDIDFKLDLALDEEDDSINNVEGKLILESINYTSNKIDALIEELNGDQLTKQELDLSGVYIKYHRPHTVIRLGSEICFGYLIFPNLSLVNNSDGNTLTSSSSKQLLKKLLGKINIPNKDKHLSKLSQNAELRKVLSQLVLSQTNSSTIGVSNTESIRYVPEKLMVHFKLNSLKNFPYGQSIFYGQEFLGKILILIQTSIAIQRITNSGEKRIIGVEIGLPRDAKQIVNELKRKFNRKRYTMDSIGTIKDIPSALTSFEDIYLPMKDGKRFVEFDSISPSKNIADRMEDLTTIRDHFIAGLDIPPAFLSVEENLESKNTLTQQNIIFTRTILVYQKIFTKLFTELFTKIYNVINKNKTKSFILQDIIITFPRPRSLKLELDSEYYDKLTSLLNAFKDLGISKEYVLKRFLKDDIDMSEINQEKINDTLTGLLNKDTEEEEGGF